MRKGGNIVAIVLIFLFIVFSFFVLCFNITSPSEYYEEYTKNHLKEISVSQALRVSEYLDHRKNDAEVYAELRDVKKIFNKELISRRRIAKDDVYEKTKIISKEIENFIIANPELTVHDLVDNEIFKELSVQKVAGSGYSLVYSYNDGEIIAHPDPFYIGRNYTYLKNRIPQYARGMIIGDDLRSFSEGEYFLVESSGEIRDKFASHKLIPISVRGDKIVLSVTTYIEDYKTIGEIPMNLDKFLKNEENFKFYDNFYFVSKNGKIISEEDSLASGMDILESTKSEFFKIFKLATLNESFIYGPYVYVDGEIYLMTGAPVYDDNELLGYLLFRIPAENVYSILNDEHMFEDLGESYFVNSKHLLVSHLKRFENNLFVQKIETTNVESCFKDGAEGKVSLYENYNGELVFGTISKISEDLCLVFEVDENLNLENFIKENSKKSIFNILILALLGFLFIEVIRKKINKNYLLIKGKKKRKKRRSSKKQMIIWTGILILLSILFFIFISLSFNLWNNSILYEKIVFDVLLLFVALFFAKHAFSFSFLESKILFLGGSLILIIVKVSEIFINIIFFNIFFSLIFIFYFFKFLGIIFLLEGYRRSKNVN